MITNWTVENASFSNSTSSTSQPVGYWIATVVISTFAVFANAATVIVIRRSQKLRGACFILIAGASFGSLLWGATYAATNAARVGEWIGLWSLSNRSRGMCLIAGSYGFGFAALTYSWQAVAMVAIDRLFSVLAPIRYRLAGKRYAVTSLSIIALSAILIDFALIYAGGPLNKRVSTCVVLPEVMGRGPYLAFADISMTLNIVSVVCYVAMFAIGSVRKWRMKHQQNGGFANEGEHQQFMKQQATIMPAARMLAVLYVITAVIPDCITNFVPAGGIVYSTITQFKASASLVEFVSLTLRCKPFRQGLKQLVNFNRGQVAPQT